LKKNPSSTNAVAMWVATRKVRKRSSLARWNVQPASRGRITPWPRLETGNGSATPCRRPRIAAWKYEMTLCAASGR
jgi:hypothetical protein